MRVTDVFFTAAGPFSQGFHRAFSAGSNPDLADSHVLIGPNGAGKSTILHAIAACFGSPADFFERALTDAATAAVRVEAEGGPYTLLVTQEPGSQLSDPFVSEASLGQAGSHGKWRYWASEGAPTPSWWTYHVNPVVATAAQAELALVFAYGGLRTLAPGRPVGISDGDNFPLRNASDLAGQPSQSTLEQWVANTLAKRALLREAGDASGAERYDRAITALEATLSAIASASFSFSVRPEPFQVRGGFAGSGHAPLALLPEGLRSLASFLGDILMRLDQLPLPEGEIGMDRAFVLLLDEVEVHMHPKWQRRVLPAIEGLFPNAQLFMSTHSPFVVGSAGDASIYALDGGAVVAEYAPQLGRSYSTILADLMGLESVYDPATEDRLREFDEIRAEVRRGTADLGKAEQLAEELAQLSEELSITMRRQIERLRETVA